MPHDDSFPAGYVSRLVSALEARPEAAIAFGDVVPVSADDRPLPPWMRPPRFGRGPEWTVLDSLRLLFWHPAVPFRGVLRRGVAVGRGVWIPETRDTIGADACWVFAMSLVGPLVHVPGCECRKRYHPASASAAFKPTWRHVAGLVRQLRGIVAEHAPGRDGTLASLGVALWGAHFALTIPARRLPWATKIGLKRIAYGRP
jgi:hypothetical protein